MDERGQGSIEYLLLVTGSIVVATIVITLMLSFANRGKNEADLIINTALNMVS